MNQLQILAPNIKSLETFLRKKTNTEPFSSERLSIIDQLSTLFLKNTILRSNSAGVALAFWLRKSNIERLKKEYLRRYSQNTNIVVRPRGKVFHITPANVDTLFVYSWVLSFLCGNTNIVRLSTKQNEVVTQLISCINTLMKSRKELRDNNCFISYEHSDQLTEELSKWCNHRIIWGGNDTINRLRPLYLNPHSSERVFSSKFSYSVINSEKFINLGKQTRQKLMKQFFNDMFTFDQMACSSPNIIFWLGNRAPMEIFDNALQEEVTTKKYEVSSFASMRRLSYSFELASQFDIVTNLKYPGFISIQLKSIKEVVKKACGGGLLIHIRINNLDELQQIMGEEDQTITYFGLSQKEKHKLAEISMGADRIVPIGEGLAFEEIWDSYDLIDDLVSKIVVR